MTCIFSSLPARSAKLRHKKRKFWGGFAAPAPAPLPVLVVRSHWERSRERRELARQPLRALQLHVVDRVVRPDDAGVRDTRLRNSNRPALAVEPRCGALVGWRQLG